MQDICGVLHDLAENAGKKEAKGMVSILQNRSFIWLWSEPQSGRLRDCEDVLKRGVENFFKDGVIERRIDEVEADCDKMKIIIYERNAVDVLRRQMSLATADDCMSFPPCGKEWRVKSRNHPMK